MRATPEHVFISYSRDDRAYVRALADFLRGAGVPVWYDHGIVAGEAWSRSIQRAIEGCTALVVVMTPASEASRWVERELNYAERLGKPVVPLLYDGDVFFRLSDVHYDDVRSGLMPAAGFVARLTEFGERASPLSPTDRATPLERLDQLVGLDAVKERIRLIAMMGSLHAHRRASGATVDPPTLHMTFTGNPGTGMTTAARLLGEVYRDAGWLRRGHVHQSANDRLSFLAPHVGKSNVVTEQAITSAIDGILFVNEPYGMSDDDGASDAIEALISAMEQHRGRMAIILAGLPAPMDEFFRWNPGLRARIPDRNFLHFPDFSTDELLRILDQMRAARQTPWVPELVPLLRRVIDGLRSDAERPFGNTMTMRDLIRSMDERRVARVGVTDETAPYTADDLGDRYRAYL